MSLSVEALQDLLDRADVNDELVLFGQKEGAKALRSLLVIMGGTTGCETYIPSLKNFMKKLRNIERDIAICQQYTGTNSLELAELYGISASRVRQIVLNQKVAREVQ